MLPIIKFIVSKGYNIDDVYNKAMSIFSQGTVLSNIDREYLDEWLYNWLNVMCKVHSSCLPLEEGSWEEYYVSSKYSTTNGMYDIKAMVIFTSS